MKRLFFILIIFIAGILPLSGEDRFSAGFTGGYHYDAGNLADRTGFDGNVQQNISSGIIMKIDMSIFFFRSGIEFSYPFVKGKFSGSSGGNVQKTEISFFEVPVYAGINLPLRSYGRLYMGGGGAYIFGTGEITTSSGKVNINEQLFGYGAVAGVESEIYSALSFLLEWGYVATKSSPAVSSGGLYNDYSIDYSGHRIRAGFLYHFSRY